MIVDAHAHFVPEALLDELRDRRGEFPSVEMAEEKGSLAFSFAGGKRTRPVAGFLRDLGKRTAWMDAQGIDLQVIAGWLDMFGNQLPAEEGAAWAATINRHLAAHVAATGDRFRALATLPTQDGARAAEMLREARAAGFAGAMIGTQPRGRGGVLDDPGLDPFWQAAHETRAIVSIHPVFDAGDDRVHDYGMANAVGRVTDTAIALSRLIYAGHVARYPEARILVGIGGAALPWILGRLRRNAALDDGLGDPDAAIRGLWYDTLLHDPAPLRLLVDLVGPERIMLGSDMPFPIGDPEPRAILAAAGIEGEARRAIESGTARRLLDL
jgi:aminocarboxymuconate-semialdehyde decarboxylase